MDKRIDNDCLLSNSVASVKFVFCSIGYVWNVSQGSDTLCTINSSANSLLKAHSISIKER